MKIFGNYIGCIHDCSNILYLINIRFLYFINTSVDILYAVFDLAIFFLHSLETRITLFMAFFTHREYMALIDLHRYFFGVTV